MGNNGGWIKLHRSVIGSAVWDDPIMLKFWIYILLQANYKENEKILDSTYFKFERGKVYIPQTDMAELLECDRKTVKKKLVALKNAKMITFKTKRGKNGGTIISIVNYNEYQGFSQDNSPIKSPLPSTISSPKHSPQLIKNKNKKEREEAPLTKEEIERRLEQWG